MQNFNSKNSEPFFKFEIKYQMSNLPNIHFSNFNIEKF